MAVTTISEFTAVLRDQLGTTERALVAAKEAAQTRELYRHSARVLDLMDRASRNGVETTGWVPEDALSVAQATCNTTE
jgi:hypothetical protein